MMIFSKQDEHRFASKTQFSCVSLFGQFCSVNPCYAWRQTFRWRLQIEFLNRIDKIKSSSRKEFVERAINISYSASFPSVSAIRRTYQDEFERFGIPNGKSILQLDCRVIESYWSSVQGMSEIECDTILDYLIPNDQLVFFLLQSVSRRVFS